jgi:plasmid stabilization system protein ParE
MRFWVTFRNEALDDLESAITYFSKYHGLSERFTFELNTRVEQLREFPELHQRVFFDVRRMLLTKFSIALYYIVHLESELIEVIAVMDVRRDPRLWQSRL